MHSQFCALISLSLKFSGQYTAPYHADFANWVATILLWQIGQCICEAILSPPSLLPHSSFDSWPSLLPSDAFYLALRGPVADNVTREAVSFGIILIHEHYSVATFKLVATETCTINRQSS